MRDGFGSREESLRDGVVILHLAGEIDLAVQADLDVAIGRSAIEAGTALLIEMSGLTFMDSTALHALIRAKETLEARGVPLVLVGATGEPHRTLEAAGLLLFFSTAVDIEHGLSMFDRTAVSST